ncbi:MAG: glutaredoxin 3 [Gammaproteobacteria bacterium]|nr:glutaredoxin 3 [Gammaproteobacteria bacterium]MCP5136135.1 glutaredoxin 3 [Gammaproteobacteria bacterium]
MAKIEMYATASCPYCVRARTLLQRKGVSYDEYLVDADPSLRPTMVSRANGRTSVPQIFIDDRHIGGYDDMAALDLEGGLDKLLGLNT